jgi:hypothetical protein
MTPYNLKKYHLRPITCWYKEVYNKKQDLFEWIFNHIENGFRTNAKPHAHKSWLKANWKKSYAYLNKASQVIEEENLQ